MNYRNLRVEKLIEEQLSLILMRELEFDGALTTITKVEVAKDLSQAKVLLTVIPYEKSLDVLEKIHQSAGRLRFLLLKKINIKPMPFLVFNFDPSMAKDDSSPKNTE